MNIKQIMRLALLASVAISLGACGKAASSLAAEQFTTGTVNTGADKNTGTVNTGTDQNKGVINSALTANQDGIQIAGAQGLRDANGVCYNDIDKDNLCNEEDPDIDNDGKLNHLDDDLDGDGIPNTLDPDMDGDGILNIDDNDMDGDGIANENDEDMDGDGIPNVQDTDMDGDGIPNIDDNDMDGDGIPNHLDDDMDGDGISNALDPDVDGDGIANKSDNDIDGDGVVDNVNGQVNFGSTPAPGLNEVKQEVESNTNSGTGTNSGTTTSNSSDSQGGANEVRFSNSGSVEVIVNGTSKAGMGSHYLNFQDVRDSAVAKKADVSTIIPYAIGVQLDPAWVGVLTPYSTTKMRVKVYYQLTAAASPVLIGATSADAATMNTVGDLINGIGMGTGGLYTTENFAVFQKLIPNNEGATIIVAFSDVVGALPDATVKLKYTISASAKVKI